MQRVQSLARRDVWTGDLRRATVGEVNQPAVSASPYSRSCPFPMEVVDASGSSGGQGSGHIRQGQASRRFPAEPLPQEQSCPYGHERGKAEHFLLPGIHDISLVMHGHFRGISTQIRNNLNVKGEMIPLRRGRHQIHILNIDKLIGRFNVVDEAAEIFIAPAHRAL